MIDTMIMANGRQKKKSSIRESIVGGFFKPAQKNLLVKTKALKQGKTGKRIKLPFEID